MDSGNNVDTFIGNSQHLGQLCRLQKSILRQWWELDHSRWVWSSWRTPLSNSARIDWKQWGHISIVVSTGQIILPHCLWFSVYTLGPFICLCQGTVSFLLAPFLILAFRISLTGYLLCLPLAFCFFWKHFLPCVYLLSCFSTDHICISVATIYYWWQLFALTLSLIRTYQIKSYLGFSYSKLLKPCS